MLTKGIVSFDPENKHVITFVRPLTLIVGPNGVRKTTIIECLKQACSVVLPPKSRCWYTYIHDPMVSDKTETKGQIRHQFKTLAGNDVRIRSLMLTQKASEMEFKALQRLLQTINPQTGEGEKVCFGYLCADMDKEIPALMGASKAILENVIFVYQDDSSWPVEDPKTKFDDIFSATLYTKALEVIRKLYKEQAHEIKAYKRKLEILQTLKDSFYEFRASLSQEQEEIKSLKTQINGLKRDVEAIDDKISYTETTLKDLKKLEDQISISTIDRSILYEHQQTQYAALSEGNEDTDKELEDLQTKFEEQIATLQSKICKLKREMNDAKLSMRKIAKLQAEDEVHLELVNERALRIRMILKEHYLGRVPKRSFCDKVAAKYLKRIKTRFVKDLQDKKKSNEMELKSLWERWVKANNKCSEIMANKQSKIRIKAGIIKRIEAKENEKEIEERRLNSLNVHKIDKKENKLKIRLEQKKHEFSNFDSIITHKIAEVDRLEQQIISLGQDRYRTDNDAKETDKLLAMKKLKQLWQERESLRDELKVLDYDLHCVMMRYHSAREEKMDANIIVETLNKVKKDLISLAEEKSQVELDEKHLAEAIGPLLKEREKLMQEYTALRKKLDDEYCEHAQKKRKFKQQHDEVQALSSKIKKYKDSGKEEKVKDLQEDSILECCKEEYMSRKLELSMELLRMKESLKSICMLKRNIDKKINYRETKKEVERLTREIDMLEGIKSSMGVMEAFEKQKQEKERLVAKINFCRGSLSGWRSHISKYKLRLKWPEYEDIDKRYLDQLTQLKTSEMANKHLERCYTALQKAFRRFHREKMQQMNKIIKELWQQTYTGQDIDYISILPRSQGYRVVMQTQNGKIDMHRRFSADQKVLACIIVRLALAETFCPDCGILAIDEPTAEVDVPTAEGLAAALLRTMEERRGQENFQLIVATEDEHFAQLIIRSQDIESYYRVTEEW